MKRYAAFLRGINVTGRRVSAKQLTEPLESLGYENVSAFLASGNLVFDASGAAKSLESKIEKALRDALGFEVATFVRSEKDLRAIADRASSPPLQPADGEAVHVSFLKSAPSATVKRRTAEASRPDDVLEIHGRELYWLRRGKMMETTLDKGSAPEDLVGKVSTSRNANTVHRMLAKFF